MPYYVYELRDPRTNIPFYVGKGKNSRVHAHGAEAAREEQRRRERAEHSADDDSSEESSEKIRKIREIRQQGAEVIDVIVGRFQTEDEAYAVESVLIKWVYGFENLTNKVHGHRHALIRPLSHAVSRAYMPIPGVDILRRANGLYDGTYTKDQIEQIQNNLIVEKLEAIRDALHERPEFQLLAISDPDVSKPLDPCVMISGFKPSSVNIQVKLQLTGKRVVLNLVPSSRAEVEHFRSAVTEIVHPYMPKIGNRFGCYVQSHDFVTAANGMRNGIPHEHIEKISKLILESILRLQERRQT